MKYKNVLLAAAACMLILSAGAGSAWAYFTTYTEASGGYQIQLGSQSTPEEDFSDWTKHLVVTNDAASNQPVYIRAKAFSGSKYTLSYSSKQGKWASADDGYYYYSDIVLPGHSTEDVLDIEISGVPKIAEEGLRDGDNFNVAVVYESTPVCYREDGTPYANWNQILDTGSTTEGGATE